jgi:hypothetical protein
MIYFWLQVNKKMLRAAKILERMVNQNTYDEIAQGKPAPSTSHSLEELEMVLLVMVNTNKYVTKSLIHCGDQRCAKFVVISLPVSTDY